MSSTLGIGVPVPKMLPITGTWTIPFASYLVFLSSRIVSRRMETKKYMGDRLVDAPESTSNDNPDPLFLECRAHNNFIESVPFCFTLVAIAELNGANRKVLNYAMATLFVLRILHVEVGLKGKDTVGLGRPTAYFGTQAFIAGMAAYGTYLVKGYWGY